MVELLDFYNLTHIALHMVVMPRLAALQAAFFDFFSLCGLSGLACFFSGDVLKPLI